MYLVAPEDTFLFDIEPDEKRVGLNAIETQLAAIDLNTRLHLTKLIGSLSQQWGRGLDYFVGSLQSGIKKTSPIFPCSATRYLRRV
jgi:hypothetical protein